MKGKNLILAIGLTATGLCLDSCAGLGWSVSDTFGGPDVGVYYNSGPYYNPGPPAPAPPPPAARPAPWSTGPGWPGPW